MKLYHGTNLASLPSIQKNGIRPRGRKSGKWGDKYASRADMVYLTDAYPLYFAINALKDKENECLIVEIDGDKLEEYNFYPDEDYIAQVLSRQEPGSNLETIHKKVRKELKKYQPNWERSLKGLGNVCYYGIVPPEAITRYCIIDISKRGEIGMVGNDPSISLMNYAFMSAKYKGLVSWLFGDAERFPSDGSHFGEFDYSDADESFKKMMNERKTYWETVYKDRTGIQIVPHKL